MTASRWRRALVAASVLGCAAATACTPALRQPASPAPPTPAAVSPAAAEWPAVQAAAQQAMLRHEFARADSELSAFAARHPGTDAAVETHYWRALVHLDPAAERPGSRDDVREARAALDAYLAAGPSREHYVEAMSLRRVTGHLDSLHLTADAVRPVLAPPPVRDSARARDDEVARLRAELDQTKAELDRIRRRLAPPRPSRP